MSEWVTMKQRKYKLSHEQKKKRLYTFKFNEEIFDSYCLEITNRVSAWKSLK